MNNPKNHHFVPEVYLKEFANSQRQLFVLKKGFTKVSLKAVGQVCYKPNYFKFNSKENLTLYNITDQYHIEKNVFKKHENRYPKLLKKLTQPSLSSLSITRSEAINFLDILITIKKRNPIYRESVITSYKNYITSGQFKKDIETGMELSKKIDIIDTEEYLLNYVKEASTDEGKQSDMYLRQFLDKENKNTEDIINTFLEYKLYVYHAPFGNQFITSDNPGFTLLPTGELLPFGGLGLQFKFIFPLTPKCCLFVTYKDTDNMLLLNKDIHVVYTDKNTVDIINNCTSKMSIERVFAYSEYVLERLLDELNH